MRNLDELAPEPTERSCDTGQLIPSFDSCQLTILWTILQAPTLARKVDISHWFPRGADGWMDTQSHDYQNFSGG